MWTENALFMSILNSNFTNSVLEPYRVWMPFRSIKILSKLSLLHIILRGNYQFGVKFAVSSLVYEFDIWKCWLPIRYWCPWLMGVHLLLFHTENCFISGSRIRLLCILICYNHFLVAFWYFGHDNNNKKKNNKNSSWV